MRPARGGAHIWRRPMERCFPACLRPSFKLGRLSLSVWGGFTARRRTTLVRVEGRLNQHKYIDMLHNHLSSFEEAEHGRTSSFMLLHDSSWLHRARAVPFYMSFHGL